MPDPADALAQVENALAEVATDLGARARAATGTLAETLDAAATMAGDPALVDEVRADIDSGLGPATALDRAVEKFAATFRSAGGYLAERISDLMSVRDRVIARLLGLAEPGIPALAAPSVILADDLTPADTASVDLALVAAIVTERGGPTSHTAIIASQLGIPCIVGAREALQIHTGSLVAVDAAAGTVIVDPAAEVVETLKKRARRLVELEADSEAGATADGRRVNLLANIGTPADAQRAADTSVEGVGLFRTEVLFLDSQNAPSIDVQAATYTQVLAGFADSKVVIRTLDAGADKPLAFATLKDEANPALGVRGYRTTRMHPQLLAEQLEAIARASARSQAACWVMAPMIATPDEARDFAVLARQHGIGNVGVMVEIPSAALMVEQILEHVDFLSVGTNDLAQYTMAADRLSTDLTDLTSPWQPAILQLIARTVHAGEALGKPVGVCGESAGDPLMATVLTGLGVKSLSMASPSVPSVRFALRHHTSAECEAMASAALGASNADQARATVLQMVHSEVREILALGKHTV